MTVQKILKSTEHRPWEIPAETWKYYQEWNRAIFLHWEVDLEELKKFVPKGLEIDLFSGKPWVSIVAFSMEKIRPKNLPSFPPISNFEEVNIRTYVKANNKTGVYFLSIEGGSKLSCKVAKTISKLPYRYSNMNRTDNLFTSLNSKYMDSLHIEFDIGSKIKEKCTLDKWLTERYALFQDCGKTINEFEIHHLEWPINDIKISSLEIEYPRFSVFINDKPDRVHYSDGIKVLAWG